MAHGFSTALPGSAVSHPLHETAECPRLPLFGPTGELVGVRIGVDSRSLEDLLEALALLDFPVNPRLVHTPGVVRVEFPAYTGHIEELRRVLREEGFEENSVEVFGILDYEAASSGG